MVEAKQYYILKAKQLVLLIRPGTSFLVEEYHPWNKDHNSYVCIKSDGNIDVHLEVLPLNLPGLVFFHNHSFPVFRNKRQATFYGHLSILLSVLQKDFFSAIISYCQQRGLVLSIYPKPTYVLLGTKMITPFAFLHIDGEDYMFEFLDSSYGIIHGSIIKYTH